MTAKQLEIEILFSPDGRPTVQRVGRRRTGYIVYWIIGGQTYAERLATLELCYRKLDSIEYQAAKICTPRGKVHRRFTKETRDHETREH